MESIRQDIWLFRNETFPSNSYLLKSSADNTCLVIDPGLDAEHMARTIDALKLKPVAVLATHGHFDHIGTVAFFQKTFNIPYYLHEADLKLSKAANFYLKMARLKKMIETPAPDQLFEGAAQQITIGAFNLSIFNFPGHSFGSVIIQYNKYLFSGDILYKKGMGFNNFPGEDKNKLKASILSIFEKFSDDDLILPGHGISERLSVIRNENIELNEFLSEKG